MILVVVRRLLLLQVRDHLLLLRAEPDAGGPGLLAERHCRARQLRCQGAHFVMMNAPAASTKLPVAPLSVCTGVSAGGLAMPTHLLLITRQTRQRENFLCKV